MIIKAQRLAHVIYLNNEYPYSRVNLTLISSRDFIWSLEFLHYESKRTISFHFQSRCLSEAQDWYMSIYHTLPTTTPACKKPIPSSIDIHIILNHQQHQHPSIKIRLPFEHILKSTKHDTLMNVRMEDIKPIIRLLLQREGLLHMIGWSNDDTKLCWRIKVSSDVEDTSNQDDSALIASGDRIEWITESTELIGPQLIEQVMI